MKKLSLLLLCVCAVCLPAFAQTLSLSLITAPCANNGVLQATATGLSGTVTYYFFAGGASISNTTGTLTGYGGGPVIAYATNGTATASATYAGAPPFTFSLSSTSGVCPTLATATATVTGGTSPYTIVWYPYGSTTPAATGATVSLPGTVYTVEITDAAGCKYGSTASGDSIYLNNISPVSFSLSATPASCTNGTITSSTPTGGLSPYSYLWNNAATTPNLAGLVRGYYTLTVTDANGCSAVRSANVAQNPVIAVNTTSVNASCLLSNGSITAFGSGGVSPYTYLWSNLQTTQQATGLTGGVTYTVTATDANGCTGQRSVFLPRSTPINATYTATASSCTTANGTATVSATGGTGPYTIVWNTFPVQTGTSATGLAPGSYGFTVTDASGCVRTGLAVVPPVSVVNATTSTLNATCTAANGAATVVATAGASPFTYLWSNSATTSTATGLAAGSYSVTVTDNMGCKITKSATVNVSTPVSVGLSVTPASCIYNSDGSIAATPTGGTAPYTYSWYGVSGSGSTASALASGNYYVSVTDAAGCQKLAFASVGYNAANTSCYCTITGTVYNDLNLNCVKDAGEPGIPNIMIHCSGRGYVFTDAAGVYSIKVPTGTYTLSESVQAYYPLASCQSNAVSVSVTAATACTSTVNFANTSATIHDMKVHTVSYAGPPVPGNPYYQTVIVKNEGTVTESSILAGYKHDGQLGTPSVPATWSLFGPAHYRSNSGFTTLAPAASQSFTMQYSVPTNIPLLTGLEFNDSAVHAAPMSNWLTDYTPWNNVHTYYSAVRGSFDPNNKEVTPTGTGSQGYITTDDSVLTYTINFQNTGNWPAQKVVLKDTLSQYLDVATLKPFAGSHPFTAEVTDGTGIVTFTFDNINLPDSNFSKLGSMGYVVYTIRQKPNLPVGTQIENSASIYFDYNAPVKTNTTLNTIESSSVNVPGTAAPGKMAASIYPNPASDKVTIMIQSDGTKKAAQIRLVSLVGQVMQQQQISLQAGRNVYEAATADLAPGLYFVEITDGVRVSTIKLSIVR
jgi:hypothetical protein